MGCFEAGASLHRIAMSYGMKNDREAYRRALREYPNLALEYNTSSSDVPPLAGKGYRLSASERAMELAQVDRDQNRKLAGELLDVHAKALSGSNLRGATQVNPESYRRAMAELMAAFPDLGECYSSGVVAPDNWALLATMIPSLAGEIKRTRGVDPYNLRSGRYSDSRGVRKYSNDAHIHYDAAGREFRSYSFAPDERVRSFADGD